METNNTSETAAPTIINVTLPPNEAAALERVQMRLAFQFGFKPTVEQTVLHLINRDGNTAGHFSASPNPFIQFGKEEVDPKGNHFFHKNTPPLQPPFRFKTAAD